jgi:hypothetical protein
MVGPRGRNGRRAGSGLARCGPTGMGRAGEAELGQPDSGDRAGAAMVSVPVVWWACLGGDDLLKLAVSVFGRRQAAPYCPGGGCAGLPGPQLACHFMHRPQGRRAFRGTDLAFCSAS